MTLKKNEKSILDYIREGRNTLADFTDNLNISAPEANKITEELEVNGYIVREEYTGIKSFNYLLTDKGVSELSDLSEQEKDLLTTESINLNQYKVLNYVKDKPGVIAAAIAEDLQIPPMELISDLCFLVNKEFVKETGLLRRKITINSKGLQVLDRYESKAIN